MPLANMTSIYKSMDSHIWTKYDLISATHCSDKFSWIMAV